MKAIKILAVNDSKLVISLFRVEAKARKMPIALDEAYNGEEAVEKIREGNTYDAILMNLEMPCMDGITATEEIRKLCYTKPIFAWTFHHKWSRWAACEKAGMDGFVTIGRGNSIDEVLDELKKANIVDTWERKKEAPKGKSMLEQLSSYEKYLDSL